MTTVNPEEAIAALEAALASGEMTVEYAGRRVTFQSAEDIVTRLNYFRSRKPAAPSLQPAPAGAARTTYVSFGEG